MTMAKPKKKSKFIQGYWKCTAEGLYSDTICGQINPGPEQVCKKCNTHRPKDVKFFWKEGEQAITDQKTLEKAKAGPDWKCMHCNYDNAAEEIYCKHCSTIRVMEEEEWLELDQSLKKRTYAAGEGPNSPKKKLVGDPKKAKRLKWLKIAALLAAIFVAFLLFKVFFGTTNQNVTVTGFKWDRAIEVEVFKTLIEEDWNPPGDARIIDEERKQSGTEEVYSHSEWTEEPVYEEVKVGEQYVDCGTIDHGNGYIEQEQCLEDIYETRQVGTERVEHEVYVEKPVYDTWYTYEIDRWVVTQTNTSSGNDQNPFWPEYSYKNNEREGNKSGEYIVLLKNNDPNAKYKTLTYSLSESEWKKISVGDEFQAKVRNTSGEVISLKPIQ